MQIIVPMDRAREVAMAFIPNKFGHHREMTIYDIKPVYIEVTAPHLFARFQYNPNSNGAKNVASNPPIAKTTISYKYSGGVNANKIVPTPIINVVIYDNFLILLSEA